MTKFQKMETALAGLPALPVLKFEREDWSLFRTVEGLQQRAGVTKDKLTRLVLKELADNGLDNKAEVSVSALPGKGSYVVEDDGSGIEGTPKDIARLFSINRPMLSTKLLRLPTRGALGNGLRVVAGAVLVSGGTLVVSTRNRQIELRPERDGTTTVVSVKPIKHPVGTRIEISFGPTLPCDTETLVWAKIACELASGGQHYLGKSSPWWYDAPQFHELLYASDKTPVRELIAHLDGCSGGKAGEIIALAGLERAICNTVTRAQATTLLQAARESTRPVQPKRLGAVGKDAFDLPYACALGIARFGSDEPRAEIPFVVEAWAARTKYDDLVVCVNRTPITGAIEIGRDKREINAFGCGLSDTIAHAPREAAFKIWLNVTTPYMPLMSDGKAPDLTPFFEQIAETAEKAVRKAHRPEAGTGQSQKDVVLDNLDAVIATVSGDGAHRFMIRQLLYRLRPIVMAEIGEELKVGNFTTIITDYENERGEIPGMYREPRGTIYHPHLDETITLGTLMVEEYERPSWTFNKLVYIEKEGFSEALKDERWAERHDCALISSKGFSTRAARDLVDKLAEHDEPVTIFCVHDADAYGTVIYQTFQQETKARGARKIEIINLGLEPWEALEMGLEVETVEAGERRKPVADYVIERDDLPSDYDADADGDWADWLQTHRVELNAMTTPEFIAWLDGKMAAYDKLVPPPDVLNSELAQHIEDKIRADLTERILLEGRFEDRVAAAVAATKKPSAPAIAKGIKRLFEREPDREWRDHIKAIVAKMRTY
jgi:hypothetical protein